MTLSKEQLAGPCLGSDVEEPPSIGSSGPVFLCLGLGWRREPGRSKRSGAQGSRKPPSPRRKLRSSQARRISLLEGTREHFHLQNLYFNFYLSTKYKLCFILVYRNRFSCQTIKTTFLIFLLGFSLSHLIQLTHYTYRSISQVIISVLSELVTPEVLQVVPTDDSVGSLDGIQVWCSDEIQVLVLEEKA